MMMKLSKLIYARSNLLICLILTLIMILYASLILGSKGECVTSDLSEGVKLLGLRFGYSYDSAAELIRSLDYKSLTCYSNLLKIWDNIFPVIYCSMYIFWISLIFKNFSFKYSGLSIVNLYPLLPAIFDFAENYFENTIITTFLSTHEVPREIVSLASILTQTKWTLSILNYILLLTGIALFLNKQIKRKTKSRKGTGN